jgi:zinc protease
MHAFALMVALAAPPEGVFPYPIHVQKLDNGLTLVVAPMPSEGLVSYRTAVRTGSRDEVERGRSGFAHFFEHMMFRGTEKYPEAVYEETVTRMGADANAFTSSDITVYQLDIASVDLERVMDIESDRFMNLAYSEAVFRTEAGAVYGEYRKNRASPHYQLAEALAAAAFTRHTYSHLTIGLERDIARMPKMYDYSRSFFERFYRPENAIVIVAGDVEPEATLAALGRWYGPWKAGYVAPKVPTEPAQKQARRVEVQYEGSTLPLLTVAYKGGAFAPDDRNFVASLLLADLAFGPTSAIYRRLMLDERVVQSIGADPAGDRDPGLWTVDATVRDPAKVEYVLAQIDATIAEYREAPPDPERLAAVKSHRRYEFLLGLDSPAAVAGAIARIAAITGDPRAHDRLYATVAAVTPEDVHVAARALFDDRRRTVATLRGKP